MIRQYLTFCLTLLSVLFFQTNASAAGGWFGQGLPLFPAALIMLLLVPMVTGVAIRTAPGPLRAAFAAGAHSHKSQTFTVLSPLLALILWIAILAAGEFSLLPLFFPLMQLGYGLSSLMPGWAACAIVILAIPIQYFALGKFLDALRRERDHCRKARSFLFAGALILTIALCFTSSVSCNPGPSSRPAFEQQAFEDSVFAYALLGALLTVLGIRWRRGCSSVHATAKNDSQSCSCPTNRHSLPGCEEHQ